MTVYSCLVTVLATPVCGIVTLFSILVIFFGCINNDRVRVCRARASSFQKISFTFTSKAGNAVYKGFPPISTRNALSNYLHPSFTFCIGEGSMKVPHTFALAGNAREPLFIEHFGISGEGEGYFLCCKVMASTSLLSIRHCSREMVRRCMWYSHGLTCNRRPSEQASKDSPAGLYNGGNPFSRTNMMR